MAYTTRLATLEDLSSLVPLWQTFIETRAAIDPSHILKPNFNYERYVAALLSEPLTFCWVLAIVEENAPSQQTIVGCLFTYFEDESPAPGLSEAQIKASQTGSPFLPRRCGYVLGIYIEPEHRLPKAILRLVNAGIQHAESLKVTDIDILSSADQTGFHALLQRLGFHKAAVQFTRHYDIPADAKLPNLRSLEAESQDLPPYAIPFHDPETEQIVCNPQGQPVFLTPLPDYRVWRPAGSFLTTAAGLPIYPLPVRHPETQEWVFNDQGELVFCPVLLDDKGLVIEHDGVPQFHPPAYESSQGLLDLKTDAQGRLLFLEVKRNSLGQILYDLDGKPMF